MTTLRPEINRPPWPVVFATPVFGRGTNGPETYARYLWEGFRDDPEIEFHVVAPEFDESNPRWHPSGRGSGSLDLYRRNALTAMRTAAELGSPSRRVIIHVNTSSLDASLSSYPGPLWGQVNDYENTDVFRNVFAIIRRNGLRRLAALLHRRRLEKRFIARQDLTLCNSDFTRMKILDEYTPARPERILTLHKAVDVSFFRRPETLPPDPLQRPDAALKLVFVGSDFVRKGLETLFHAVSRLPARTDWSLVVIGPERDAVMQQYGGILSKETWRRVGFAGRLNKEQLRAALWHSQIFVLPSRAEAFGVALLEALAAGLPVVSCHVGGIPEIVSHPDVGMLVPPDDVPALTHALMQVQPWVGGKLPQAVTAILEKFSAPRMTSRLRELYMTAFES